MLAHNSQRIGSVLSSSPAQISVSIDSVEIVEQNKENLQVGRYLKIEDGNLNFAVAVITDITGVQSINPDGGASWKFTVNTNPVGSLIKQPDDTYSFKRGTKVLPVPMEPVHTLGSSDLEGIFSKKGGYQYKIGVLSGNKDVDFLIDGNKFFSKHIGIVGSTGSGKSCAVTSLLHGVLSISGGKNENRESQKNPHIVIFDIHSEYSAAFKLDKSEAFTLNLLDVDRLVLPYWLMNSEELESLFIDSGDRSAHNEVSQFKRAVTLNKEKYNPGIKGVTYDSPVYFDLVEVYNYIKNKNNMTTFEDNGVTYFAIKDSKVPYNESLLWSPIDFIPSSGNGKSPVLGFKVSKDGGFTGEFDRFVSRLEIKLNDKRLGFLLSPKLSDKVPRTEDFQELLLQLIGYSGKANVSIIDLSGIPFEVLSITVSLVSRLLFDFAFHYSKARHMTGVDNDIPFLLVCEEAHNYIPRNSESSFKASKQSIERIAKEGRKYGLSLMVVSQRPSEVSDTIFSQCNNFVALRLTNDNDQSYIKSLLPDSSGSLIDSLPTLGQGEAIVVGDAVVMPSLVQVPMPNPEPKSASIDVYDEWKNVWVDASFESTIARWTKS